MRIYNPTYKKIAIDWDNVTLPVNEGTPFSADGTIANTSDAIGLLPVYIWKKPIDEEVYILIGGDVYQSEVEEAFGAELTDDAIASMGGINFYEADGTIDKASGGGGSGFRICHCSDLDVLDIKASEIIESINNGIPVIYIDSGENSSDTYICDSWYKLDDSPYTFNFRCGAPNEGEVIFYLNPFIADTLDTYPYLD